MLRLAPLSDEMCQQLEAALWASDHHVYSSQGWTRQWGPELDGEERGAHWVGGAAL
jgi:hypothetical protein